MEVDSKEYEVIKVENDGQESEVIEVENDEIENEEELLLADDGDHESLPGNDLDDEAEALLGDDNAEQPIAEDLYDEALLGDKDSTEGDVELKTDELYGDVVDDASNAVNNINEGVSNDVDHDVTDEVEIDVVGNDVNDDADNDVIDAEETGNKEQKTQETLVENNMNEIACENSGLVEQNSEELSITDKVVDQDENNVENKILIEEFQTKPLSQSSHDGNRDKLHNNGPSKFYNPRHNSFEGYPSCESGVGTISSLDSMFDEFEDLNYTSFGGPTDARRT